MKDDVKPPDLDSDPMVKAVAAYITKATGEPARKIHKISRLIPPDEYVKLATNHELWFRKAVGIERCAAIIWRQFVDASHARDAAHRAKAFLETAHLLYGLALEVALKGELIRLDPDNVDLQKSMKKGSAFESVSFKGMRGVEGDGHDLVKLAERAGLLSEPNTKDLREALSDLTACIRWQSRYPVPKGSKGDGLAGNIHFSLKNRWIKDWVSPLLDRVIGNYRATA